MADENLLDLCGLRCPMPVIRLEAVLRQKVVGTEVIVVADDPIAAVDIPHAMRDAGHLCVKMPSSDPAACVFKVTKRELTRK